MSTIIDSSLGSKDSGLRSSESPRMKIKGWFQIALALALVLNGGVLFWLALAI